MLLISFAEDDEINMIVDTIRASTHASQASALDDLHMSLRYATFIDALLESTMQVLAKRQSKTELQSNDNPYPTLGSDLLETELYNDYTMMHWLGNRDETLDWSQSSGFDLLDNLVRCCFYLYFTTYKADDNS